MLFVAVLGVAAVAGCSKKSEPAAQNDDAEKKLAALTVDEVAAKIATPDGKTFIYDNNDKKRYAEGHVPGAKWLDEENVTAADLPADKSATLIFYCHSETWHACHIAAVAAKKLGYTNVFIMPAGITGWEDAKKPVEKA